MTVAGVKRCASVCRIVVKVTRPDSGKKAEHLMD
jgi:hypothetical protein